MINKKIMCVAAEDHRFLVTEAMELAHVRGTVLLEPAARNTAAAMALTALSAQPSDVLLFCPADHHIPDAVAFAAMAQQGLAAIANGAIVTFGIVPSFPSSAFGYIQKATANADGNSHQVARFVEKPPADEAQALILEGNALWNAGIFLTRAETLLHALQQHAPDILHACIEAMAGANQDQQANCTFVRRHASAFKACRAESIDYAVMERHTPVAVIPFGGAWSDVGSWNTVDDLTTPDAEGNAHVGQGLTIHASRTFIHAPPSPCGSARHPGPNHHRHARSRVGGCSQPC